jgi:hypothetical protein
MSRVCRRLLAAVAICLSLAGWSGERLFASGQFKDAKYYQIDSSKGSSQAIATGDFDGDGNLDVALAPSENESGEIKVFRGDGKGGFSFNKAICPTVPISGNVLSMITADLNHRGELDLAVLTDSPKVAILRPNHGCLGSPSYYYPVTGNGTPYRLVAGDFWGQGRLDLAVSFKGDPNSSPSGKNASVAVLKNMGVAASGEFGAGSFKGVRSIPVAPTVAFGIAAGRIYGGAKDDLVIATGSQVYVMQANTASFELRNSFTNSSASTINSSTSVSTGDFNKDGNLDLVVVTGDQNSPSSKVQIWLGNGKGNFQQRACHGPCPSASYLPSQVAVTDFNADGNDDIWVVNGDDSVTVFLGKGDGTFSQVDYAAGINLVQGTTGDFRNDGKVDIAVVDLAGGTFGILLGNGDGSFYDARKYRSESATSLAVGDFNEDGNSDIVAIAPGAVQILLGDGKGGFSLRQSFPAAAAVGVGDFDLDGHQDIALVDTGSASITILFGDGKGGFPRDNSNHPVSVGVLPVAISVADFNGDGILDLAVTDAGVDFSGPVVVYVLIGSGNGSFLQSQKIGLGKSSLDPKFVVTGEVLHRVGNDLHRVGNDLVVTNCGTGDCQPGPTTGANLSVLLGSGDGSVASKTTISVNPTSNAVIGDFDLDGNGDVAVGTDAGLVVFWGNGKGAFQPLPYKEAPITFLATGDVNGDGQPDLIAINNKNQVVVLLGNKNRTFRQTPTNYLVNECLSTGLLGDFNRDGALDFVTSQVLRCSANTLTDGLAVLLNSGGTRMSLSSSQSIVTANQQIQLNATIADSLEGAPSATGTVTFSDISTFPVRTLGTGQIKAGQAHLTASVGDPGVHTFEANYSGDKNFNPNTATASVQAQEGGTGAGGSGSNPGFGPGCSTKAQNSSQKKSAAVESNRVLRREGSATLNEGVDNQAAYRGPETVKHSELRREESHEESARNGEALERETLERESLGEVTKIVAPNNPISDSTAGFHGFDGLDAQDSRDAGHGNQSTTEPPDEGMAVGNGQVLQAINDAVAVYALNGKQISGPKTTNAFFNLAPSIVHGPNGETTYGPFVSDPNVLFDADTQRWFVTAVRIATNSQTGDFVNKADVMIAVSKTPNATGGYDIYSIDITDPGFAQCPCASDQPLLGANRDGIYISANQYSLADGTFQSGLILALGKQRLVAGQTPVSIGFQTLTQDGVPGFSIYPARTSDTSAMPAGVEYFMSTLDFAGVSGEEPLAERGDHRITVWALGNTASLRTDDPGLFLEPTTINSEPYAIPPAATQMGGKPRPLGGNQPLEKLDANDDRMQQVFFAAGELYGAVNTRIGSPGNSSRVGIAWFEVQPKIAGCTLDAKIARQGYIAVADGNVMFPAIAVNEEGNGAIGFSVVGPTRFPSFGYTEISATSIDASVHIAAKGTAPEDGFSGYVSEGGDGVARWGDYSAAAVASDGSIWFAGEYITGRPRAPQSRANWGTFIGALPPTQ